MLCVQTALSVMAGLVPPIHAAPLPANPKFSGGLATSPNALAFGWDDRDKPGHDGVGFLSCSPRRLKFWLAALAFVLAPGLIPDSASADAPPVCAGHDLSNNPDVRPDLAAHADDLVNGEGLLWRVEKSGLAPSFLYGTIHSTNAAAISLAGEAMAYLDGAKVVATELGGPMDAAAKADLGAGMLRAALSPKQDTLAGALSAKDLGVVDTFLSARGYPPEMSHHLKLWFLAVAASLPLCEAEAAQKGLPEVDEMIAEFGQGHGLPVVALETVAEQTQTLTSVPNQLAATMLLTTARAPYSNDDAYVTLLSLYSQKRPALAIAVLDALPGLTQEERSAEAEFTRLLLVGRNELMMKRSAPLFAKGGAFVAVGALHLPGKGGLIERARAAGYRVTKIW
jgi:uncharacterized protein YbaP (TraB family)